MKHLLFVCLGNICRSPLAQGIFESLTNADKTFFADSAGTSAWHKGEKPHHGSIKVAQKHGINISRQKSRQVTISDNNQFDIFVAMDSSNAKSLQHEFGIPEKKIILMRQFESQPPKGVPDPYGLSDDAFEEVFQILKKNMKPFLEYLNR